MKKLLSILMIASSLTYISTDVSACVKTVKKSSFWTVYNKMKNTDKNLTWNDSEAKNSDNKVHLEKTDNNKPISWISLLTNVFKLSASEDNNELRYITNITDNDDNLMENGTAEEITISLSQNPESTTKFVSQTVTRTITWNDKHSELMQDTIDAIDSANINVKAQKTLSDNPNDVVTKSAILNNINLNEDQQKLITNIDGNLILNSINSLEFSLKYNEETEQIKKNVGWFNKGENNLKNNVIRDTVEYNGSFYAIVNKTDIYISNDNINYELLQKFSETLVRFEVFNNQLYLGGISKLYIFDNANNEFIDECGTAGAITEIWSDGINLYLGEFRQGAWKLDVKNKVLKQIDASWNDTTYTFAKYDGTLYIGYTSKDKPGTGGVAKLVGDKFVLVDDADITDSAYSLIVFNNQLYAGIFDGGIWKFDGTKFNKVDTSFNKNVTSFINYNNKLYIGTDGQGAYIMETNGNDIKINKLTDIEKTYCYFYINSDNTLTISSGWISISSTEITEKNINYYYSLG